MLTKVKVTGVKNEGLITNKFTWGMSCVRALSIKQEEEEGMRRFAPVGKNPPK